MTTSNSFGGSGDASFFAPWSVDEDWIVAGMRYVEKIRGKVPSPTDFMKRVQP